MKKDEKLQLTKDKLVDAAFELMEKAEDPMAVTSREIAARAEVKPAMINYCFGSRENLIYNAFQKQYLNFLKDKEVEDVINSDLPPDQVLKKTSPDALRAFLVSAVAIGVFLPLSVRVFDKKDIK